jgi:predicted DNA binding protein
MSGCSETKELLRLKLRIWHRDCWTLQVTDGAGGKLLGHGTSTVSSGRAQGRFTVYADTVDAIESLIEAARSSPLTHSVIELHDEFTLNGTVPSGTPTREVFVEYDPRNSIDSELATNGFVRDEPNRIAGGWETWRVVTYTDREEMRRRLGRIRESMDAEIDVRKIASTKQRSSETAGGGHLSDRQREIFEYAQSQGYYTWPRDVTVKDLAVDLDVSKTTVLEHLRKAEAKILGSR